MGSQRGGVTTRGVPFNVQIHRQSEGKVLSCRLDYDKMAKGNPQQNIRLQGGDIVTIPKTVTTVMYDAFRALFPPWNDMVGAGTRVVEVYETNRTSR